MSTIVLNLPELSAVILTHVNIVDFPNVSLVNTNFYNVMRDNNRDVQKLLQFYKKNGNQITSSINHFYGDHKKGKKPNIYIKIVNKPYLVNNWDMRILFVASCVMNCLTKFVLDRFIRNKRFRIVLPYCLWMSHAHLEVMKTLMPYYKKNPTIFCIGGDKEYQLDTYFIRALNAGALDTAEWLEHLSCTSPFLPFDINASWHFLNNCFRGGFEICKWMIRINQKQTGGRESITPEIYQKGFDKACEHDLVIAQWLLDNDQYNASKLDLTRLIKFNLKCVNGELIRL